MALDELKSALPDYAKDLKLNLGSVIGNSELPQQLLWGTVFACAIASRSPSVLREIEPGSLLWNDDPRLKKLHNPIGLDIGAEGPEQIALAILSEIQAVFSGHAGGLLREKKGPIHAAAVTA